MEIDGPESRLWVETRGAGAPVTILAHGLASSSTDLIPLADRLPGTVVLTDFRGHGRSESPPERAGYDHGAMRADLEFVAERVAATHAVGVSMGAGVILNLLCDRPMRFERVVLVMPSRLDDPCPDPEGTERFAEQLETMPLDEVADMLLAHPDLNTLLTREPRWGAQIREQLLRMNATGVPRALRAYARGPAPVPDPEKLRAVRARTLIAAHENDGNHPAAVAHRLGELIPNADVRIWEREFAMMLDDLDEFAALVGTFLTRAE